MIHATNGILDLLIQPPFHFIDSVDGLSSLWKTVMVLVEVVEDVGVLSVLVVADLIADLAMHLRCKRSGFRNVR